MHLLRQYLTIQPYATLTGDKPVQNKTTIYQLNVVQIHRDKQLFYFRLGLGDHNLYRPEFDKNQLKPAVSEQGAGGVCNLIHQ